MNQEISRRVLSWMPQKRPFLFVDSIDRLDQESIVARYRFREDEYFYRGHFPDRPVTPGVVLLEAMCQAGVVCQGLYLLSLEVDEEEVKRWITYFSDAQVEFFEPVFPTEEVSIEGQVVFWRRRKLRSRITMKKSNGALVAQTTASGMGVRLG